MREIQQLTARNVGTGTEYVIDKGSMGTDSIIHLYFLMVQCLYVLYVFLWLTNDRNQIVK